MKNIFMSEIWSNTNAEHKDIFHLFVIFMPAKCHHARCSPPISNAASQIKRETKPIFESWHTIVICTYLIIYRYTHEPKKKNTKKTIFAIT